MKWLKWKNLVLNLSDQSFQGIDHEEHCSIQFFSSSGTDAMSLQLLDHPKAKELVESGKATKANVVSVGMNSVGQFLANKEGAILDLWGVFDTLQLKPLEQVEKEQAEKAALTQAEATA